MAGSLISDDKKSFLESLLKETGVVVTIVSNGCAVNIHGLKDKLFLKPQKWSDGEQPEEETLLAWGDSATEKDEPPVHFHVSWDKLDSAYLTRFKLRRTGTEYALFLCQGRNHAGLDEIRKSSSLRFYLPSSSQFVRLLSESQGIDRWLDFGR